ncbi:MAG: tetratricopeptide repeat protein [Acidobacteria bacterium]|nr:MAG: tetratricopeptide repeat protein [Acidobacteriota bacterium]REJ99269.1 MAG: tetratricopeptide repeat protein [Acidobacteriota bacterium]REK16010.1 MAG: tetratricopeptide repeat protein [Acidobacteriota bacterium]REK43691.1 MAG: tetratricopeptide repeat protein [Acidobacteriota bacterium]
MTTQEFEKLETQIQELRRAGNTSKLADTLRTLGELHRKAGNDQPASRHYLEAVSIYRDLGEDLKLAHTIRHLGMIHQDSGSLEDAGDCFNEAVAIYNDAGDSSSVNYANALRALAVYKDETGDSSAALLWKEARSIYELNGIAEGVQECDEKLAA